MVRRSTWFLIVILLALVGLSYYLQRQKSREVATSTPTSAMLPVFGGQAEDPSSIRIENAAGDAVEIARAPGGQWTLEQPTRAEADQAAAQAAASQVSALRALSTVTLAPAIVGLDKPAYILTISFPGEESSHELRVGSSTPIQDGYYAQVDDGTFQVVEKAGIDELIGLLKAPPYPATPTPQESSTPPESLTAPSQALTGTPTTGTVSP